MAGGNSRRKGGKRGKKRPRPSPRGAFAKQQGEAANNAHEALVVVAAAAEQKQIMQPINSKISDAKRRDLPSSPTTANNAAAAARNKKDVNNNAPGSSTSLGSIMSGWKLFLALCLFRILNTFLIQSYFDPDEFWQTLEPAYCRVFGNNCEGLTWEWTRRSSSIMETSNLLQGSLHGPVRTYLSVLPTHVLYHLLNVFQLHSEFLVSRGPMLLAAVTVAAPIDFCVWYTAGHLLPRHQSPKKNNVVLPAWCLFCSLTSWFNGYTLVRTFSNCQETLLLMLSIALVSPELLGNNNGRHEFLRSCLAFFLGGLGVAIRFTSVAAFVPMGMLLALRKPTARARLTYLLVPCALFGLLGIAAAMVVDRFYFGFWTIPLLANFHFNVVLNMADLYGSHPLHWYFTAGLPALTGLLFPCVVFDLGRFVRGDDDMSYGQRNLWVIVLSYLLTMSMSSHKEFRFILPLLPLLCILSAPYVRTFLVGQGKKPNKVQLFGLGSVWIFANLAAVLYLGLFHQSGPISVNREIVAIAKGTNHTTDSFSIHYLTGGCHSTPLHSHLHSPPLQFDTWHLDCSPECRSDPDIICESDQFAQDPVGFVKNSYCSTIKRLQRKKCMSPPDFVVTFSEYVPQIQSRLESFGLKVVARFPHSINGIGLSHTSDAFGRITLPGNVNLSVEEIVLFSKFGSN